MSENTKGFVPTPATVRKNRTKRQWREERAARDAETARRDAQLAASQVHPVVATFGP